MRDTHGRYTSLKEITDNGPDWAAGCPNCKFGIVSAPELTGAAPLYMERMVQHLDKSLVFCDCRAGKAHYAALGNRYRKLIEEARKDKRLTDFAARTSHPDIEMARRAIYDAYASAPPPTVHYDTQPVEVMEAVTA